MKLTHYLAIVFFLFCGKSLFGQYEDCNTAWNLPNKMPINVPFVSNSGLVQDQVIDSCFQDLEHKSYWMKFKALTSGTFEFMLTPNGLLADYDFIMYDGCPCDPTKKTIACKWQGELITNFKPTGIASDPLLSFGVPPAQAAEFMNTISLVAGKTYFLLFDNITASIDPTNSVGFSAVFGGTALIGPTDDSEPGIGDLAIAGPNRACVGQTLLPFLANGNSSAGLTTTFSWTGTNGITAASNTKNTLVAVGNNSGDLCVKASDGCYAAKDTCLQIQVTTTPNISVTDTIPCHNNSFDLNKLFINDLNNSVGGISFYDNGINAQKDTLPIPNLVTKSGLYFVQKKVNDGCKDTASVNVVIQDLLLKRDTFYICANETRLDTLPMTELNGYGSNGLFFTYYADSLSAYAKKNNFLVPLVNISRTYWLRGDSKEGCYAVAPVVVIFIPFPQLPSVTNFVLCDSCMLLDTLTFAQVAKPYSTKIYPSLLFAELQLGSIGNLTVCNSESYAIRLTAPNGCYDITNIIISKNVPPIGTISGSDSICPIIGKSVDLNFELIGVGPFTGTYWDGTTIKSFVANSSTLIEKITIQQSSTWNLLTLKDSNSGACDNAKLMGTATFKELEVPQKSNLQILCDSTRTNYRVSFDITGGHKDYLINGINLAGSTFTSSAIPNDSTYLFLLQDVFGCLPDTIRGVATCKCTNSAGTIAEKDTLFACANGVLSATLNGQIFSKEDKLFYILHDRPDGKIGNVFEISQAPNFVFSSKLNFNQVYYLSAIVGDSLPDGSVDLSDNCLSVAAGRPIMFLRPDTASVGLDTFYCRGTTIALQLTSTNAGQVDYGYILNNKFTEQQKVDISVPIAVTLDSTITFELKYLNDKYGCPLVLKDSIQEIKVLPKLVLANQQLICDAIAENYVVKFDVIGSVGSQFVSLASVGSFLGSSFTSVSIPSGQSYSIMIRDQYRCDSILATGTKVCPCAKQSGAIDTSSKLVCFGDSINIQIIAPNLQDANDTTLFGIFDDPLLSSLVGITRQSVISSATLPGVILGKPYYVALLTGNKLASAPYINLNFCHGKSLPKMIVFLEKPSLLLSSTLDTICPNDTFNLKVSFSGSFPILFSDGAQNLLQNQNNFVLPLSSNVNKTFSFSVVDQNGCASSYSNYFNLVMRPLSNLGSFSADSLETCTSDTLRFTMLGQQKELRDTLYYEVLDASGSLVTRINNAKVSFGPSYVTNVWYTLRAVAVPLNNGMPQFQSGCRVVSGNAHFRFNELPVAQLLAVNSPCEGDSLLLKLLIDKDFSFYNVTVEVGNQLLKINVVGVDSTFKLKLNPNAVVKLIALERVNGGNTCIPLIDNGIVGFTFANAPTLAQIKVICAPDKLTYQLQLVVSSDLPNTLTTSGLGGAWNSNTFLSNKLLSGQAYSVTVSDGNNCKPLVLSGVGDCSCPTNVRPAISVLKPVSCYNSTDAVLAVTNVNGKAPFKFEWSNQNVGTQLNGLKAGIYRVTMTDNDNCSSTDSIVLPNPNPLKAALMVNDPKCPGLRQGSVQFDPVFGGTPPYQYQLGNQVFSSVPNFGNLVAGSYNFTLKDSRNCELKFAATVKDPEPFLLSIGRDTAIEFGDSIPLNVIGNELIDSLIWSANVLCYGVNCEKPFGKPAFEYDIYQVVGYNLNGCSASAQKKVTTIRQDDVFIPNVFSPESSQLPNQVLTVYGGRTITKIKRFSVFDRWGNQVYLAADFLPNDSSMGWDGTFAGKPMHEGVYVYYAEIEKAGGALLVLKGDVTLLRQ